MRIGATDAGFAGPGGNLLDDQVFDGDRSRRDGHGPVQGRVAAIGGEGPVEPTLEGNVCRKVEDGGFGQVDVPDPDGPAGGHRKMP